LVTATTDSRFMTTLSDSIYRYAPIAATLDELKMIHGTNERMTLENLRRTVDFYARLVVTTAGN
jgi:carboxypeptidase PM20D1